MKMRSTVIVVLLTVTFLACEENRKSTIETKEYITPADTTASTAIEYTIDTALSILNWEGYEGLSLGKAEHTGTLNISGGILNVDSSRIVSGEIDFDMRSIVVTDIPAASSKNNKLVRHLLSNDFFDTDKYPEIKFVITGIESKGTDSINVAGNLVVKGTGKNISFIAAARISDSLITAISPEFYINRKDWGMYYRSENSLGDELIRPEIGIAFNITAKRK